jgi:hypothetical protein
VTKFTYAAYNIPQISTAIQIFTEDAVPAYVSAVSDLANYQETVDTGAGGIFTIGYTPSTGAVSPQFLGVQAGSAIKPAVFDNFTAIPSAYSSYNVTTLAYWSSTLDTPYQVSRYVRKTRFAYLILTITKKCLRNALGSCGQRNFASNVHCIQGWHRCHEEHHWILC